MAASPQRLGLFGGSFDPPHWGHFFIAQDAREQADLDQIVFIPCRQSPLKENASQADAATRLAMVQAVVADLPWAQCSDIEVHREGPSYTIDTVKAYRAQFPERRLSLILGVDQWNLLSDWRSFEELSRLVTFIVFPRDGVVPVSRPELNPVWLKRRLDISSSEVRDRLVAGQEIRFFVPDPVRDIIQQRKLYV